MLKSLKRFFEATPKDFAYNESTLWIIVDIKTGKHVNHFFSVSRDPSQYFEGVWGNNDRFVFVPLKILNTLCRLELLDKNWQEGGSENLLSK